jgi:hypothetical protein
MLTVPCRICGHSRGHHLFGERDNPTGCRYFVDTETLTMCRCLL